MKKHWRWIVGIIFILSGFYAAGTDEYGIGIGFLTIAIGIGLIVWHFIWKKKHANDPVEPPKPAAPAKPAAPSAFSVDKLDQWMQSISKGKKKSAAPTVSVVQHRNSNNDDNHYRSSRKTYSYNDVQIAAFDYMIAKCNFKKIAADPVLRLQQEPKNRADSRAVAVYWHNQQLGYLYKNKLQDMANEWINAGRHIDITFRDVRRENGVPTDVYVSIVFGE